MNKYLEIMDYANEKTKTNIDINKLEDILRIDIEVITGDEICTVIYKNGEKDKFDSSKNRMANYFDCEYCLYSNEENHIDEFLKRKNSYDIDWV